MKTHTDKTDRWMQVQTQNDIDEGRYVLRQSQMDTETGIQIMTKGGIVKNRERDLQTARQRQLKPAQTGPEGGHRGKGREADESSVRRVTKK